MDGPHEDRKATPTIISGRTINELYTNHENTNSHSNIIASDILKLHRQKRQFVRVQRSRFLSFLYDYKRRFI